MENTHRRSLRRNEIDGDVVIALAIKHWSNGMMKLNPEFKVSVFGSNGLEAFDNVGNMRRVIRARHSK